jgi:hypothetical protein
LFQQISEGVFATYCVDGRNVDYGRTRNACAKSEGVTEWSNSATADALTCLGIFELYDPDGNRVFWIFCGDNSSKGRIFRYDSSRDPVRISDVVGHAGAVEWAFNTLDLYSIIRVGKHMVFADRGEHTPYCADYDDTTVSKLVSGGTEYKFRYLENWQNRIIGAYETTTGDYNDRLQVRWSSLRPVPASSCTFTATDVLYNPNDDAIIGIKKMGRNACYVYGENSIVRMDYYPSYSIIFGLVPIVDNFGAVSHHSIVDAGNMHYFFNRDLGFCEFNGQNITPINYDIENLASSIRSSYYGHIVGTFVAFKNEIAWTVPLEGSSTPNAILYYNRYNKIWRREDKTAHYIHPAIVGTNLTWTMLINDLGYTTWQSLGNLRWMDLISETPELMFANTDGKLYYSGGESNSGSAWDGYRIEPVMDFGRPNDKDLLEEIWFDLIETGNYNIYCYYRGGNTVGECTSATWEALPEVSCNSPASAVTRLAKTNRFHQIKWGTDAATEPFVVTGIEFKYVPGGRY